MPDAMPEPRTSPRTFEVISTIWLRCCVLTPRRCMRRGSRLARAARIAAAAAAGPGVDVLVAGQPRGDEAVGALGLVAATVLADQRRVGLLHRAERLGL